MDGESIDMTTRDFSDLIAEPNTNLTAAAVGDYILIYDASEPLDIYKIKVISIQDVLKLTTETARQPLVTGQAVGDLFYASAAGVLARLAKGAAGQVLKMNSGATAPEWSTGLFGAKVTRINSNQTIANNTDTAMSFDTEEYDDGGYFSLADPTKFTISEAGVYLIGAGVQINGSNWNALAIIKNASTWIGKQFIENSSIFTITTLASLAAGDYVRAVVNQTSGGDLDILATVHPGILNMWIVRVK
jgi:hypothetical protein